MESINISTFPAIFPWEPAAWLRVSGPDAAIFLQGQFSHDLRSVPTHGVYGLWLTHKGKIEGDAFILPADAPDAYWVGSYASPAAALQARLEAFIIADDVTVEDQTAAWQGLSLLGAVDTAPPPGVHEFSGRRLRPPNREWIFPRALAPVVHTATAAWPTLTPGQVERLRIEAGIPAIPRDLGPADLPNEGGLEADAISFTKGCYVGQEVMARLKSMGRIRRRLVRVRTSAPPPPLPSAVYAGNRSIGELRSHVAEDDTRGLGLALLSLGALDAGTPLAFAPDGPPALQVLDPAPTP